MATNKTLTASPCTCPEQLHHEPKPQAVPAVVSQVEPARPIQIPKEEILIKAYKEVQNGNISPIPTFYPAASQRHRGSGTKTLRPASRSALTNNVQPRICRKQTTNMKNSTQKEPERMGSQQRLLPFWGIEWKRKAKCATMPEKV